MASHLAAIRRAVDSVWSQRASASVRRLVRELDVDVLHVHNLFPTLSPLILRAAHKMEVPIVMTLHNFRLLCLPATLLRDGRICEDCVGRVPWRGVVHRCYRESLPGSAALAMSHVLHRRIGSFNLVDRFLAVSEFVRRKHVQAGIRADRIIVKPNFTWPKERRSPSGDALIFLGRLSIEKGADTVVSALAASHHRLLLVGDGPERARLERAATPNVEFIGAVPAAAVTSLLQRARAVVIPSRCYEGQPRAVLEAFAAGIPVVASDIGGLPELVQDGFNGYLVPPDSVVAWREALERLDDDIEFERLSDGAYDTWRARFSPEVAIGKLEAAYRSAIDARSRDGLSA